MYFCSNSIKLLCDHIIKNTNQNFRNDMELLSTYPNLIELPLDPRVSNIIYDAAAIGQYLGGIDPKNLKIPKNYIGPNPSIGFINETATLKMNEFIIKETPEGYFIKYNTQENYAQIACLHIHCKDLKKFKKTLVWKI